MSLDTSKINGPAGPLELVYTLPWPAEPTKPSLLFVHSSFSSAQDFRFLLPYLARHGFPAYGVSLRGHGASGSLGWLDRMVLTGLDNWAADVKAALDYITAAHPDNPPAILGGHSLGGGLVQYMVSNGLVVSPEVSEKEPQPAATGYQGIESHISGLILLASTPLTGGGQQIMRNWQRIEAPDGYPFPWSDRFVLKTVAHARALLFSEETDDKTIQAWLGECRTAEPSARAALSALSSFGDADIILDLLDGIKTRRSRRRKILFVTGTADKLVPPKMVEDNVVEYELIGGDDDEGCMKLVVEGSGHHLMMDAHWESCAQGIVNWLNGEEL